MSIKYTTRVNKFSKVKTSLEGIDGKQITVGALEGEHAWLAGIHEWGLNIKVTPAMRAYLHGQGLHLKDSTTHIHIPERAFLRNGHDKNAGRIIKQTERLIPIVLDGNMSVNAMLEECGRQFATAIKQYTKQTKPNHPFTIAQKGSSTPLTGESGGLVESITFKIEE